MKKPFQRMKDGTGRNPLRNDRGDISIYTCFFVVGIVMLVSFLLLYASIRITCINIRNGAKMELNNLSASIYADTYRSQRETNFSEYLNTLYSSGDYAAFRHKREFISQGLCLLASVHLLYIIVPAALYCSCQIRRKLIL